MIQKINLGKHQNVLVAEFGTGDISFTRARYQDEKHETLILFDNNHEPRSIGEVSDEKAGKTTDELPAPQFVLRFTKPESITALIHTLVELQKEVFDYQRENGTVNRECEKYGGPCKHQCVGLCKESC